MRSQPQAGFSLIETILLILLLLVPLVWMLAGLARLHRAALGATAAAREGGSAAVSAEDASAALRRAEEAVTTALRNQQLDPRIVRLQLSGLRSFGRGAHLEVQIAYPVRMLRIPFVDDGVGPRVWVRASHVAHVAQYRSVP